MTATICTCCHGDALRGGPGIPVSFLPALEAACSVHGVVDLAAARMEAPAHFTGWRTPPEFFARLDLEFHFTLDAAADEGSALVGRYFTKEMDGLAQDWGTERVYVNPPYDKVAPWVKKAAESAAAGALVVMLLRPSTDTAWFGKYIWDRDLHRPKGRVELRLLAGRLRFVGPPGKVAPPTGNMIVIFHPGDGNGN